MKYMFYACAIILYFSLSIAMKKEDDDKKRADKLARKIFSQKSPLDTLEKDWKKGGNMTPFYLLNKRTNSPTSNILASAVRYNKNADFIRYLIQSGADVNLEFEKDIYCLPIALASLHGNPAVVATIIECGGLRAIKESEKFLAGDGGASLLIRFIRETGEDKKALENYAACLHHLIKGGCSVQQKKVCELGVIAYISLNGLSPILYDYAHDYSYQFTTPLIEAVRLNILTFVKLLIQAGAAPDKKYNGVSAKDIAQKIAQKKSLPQKALSLFIKEEKDKRQSIIELAISEIEDDIMKTSEKVCKEERLKQEKAVFGERKRTLAIPRLTNYLSIDTKYIELKTLLELKRT
jgi:ankyrin repeat protein